VSDVVTFGPHIGGKVFTACVTKARHGCERQVIRLVRLPSLRLAALPVGKLVPPTLLGIGDMDERAFGVVADDLPDAWAKHLEMDGDPDEEADDE